MTQKWFTSRPGKQFKGMISFGMNCFVTLKKELEEHDLEDEEKEEVGNVEAKDDNEDEEEEEEESMFTLYSGNNDNEMTSAEEDESASHRYTPPYEVNSTSCPT